MADDLREQLLAQVAEMRRTIAAQVHREQPIVGGFLGRDFFAGLEKEYKSFRPEKVGRFLGLSLYENPMLPSDQAVLVDAEGNVVAVLRLGNRPAPCNDNIRNGGNHDA